jgi:hypothetical protein
VVPLVVEFVQLPQDTEDTKVAEMLLKPLVQEALGLDKLAIEQSHLSNHFWSVDLRAAVHSRCDL